MDAPGFMKSSSVLLCRLDDDASSCAGTTSEASASPDSGAAARLDGDSNGASADGGRDGSMDGLLHAYSAAAGSPRSPTLGHPGALWSQIEGTSPALDARTDGCDGTQQGRDDVTRLITP